MKLSKKNAARQSAIHRAIASGKALGGLLVGLAATVVGCRGSHTPAHTMGRFPDPRYQENATNENADEFVTGGVIAMPEDNDAKSEQAVVVPPPVFMDKQPEGRYRVQAGDTLTRIAKAHGTTVAELKRLNDFDDYRADRIWVGEVIKVPQQNQNVVNEDKGDRGPRLMGKIPSSKIHETPQKTNAVNEAQGKGLVLRGEPRPLEHHETPQK